MEISINSSTAIEQYIQPTTALHLFSRLPPEIQSKIYSELANTPRTIAITIPPTDPAVIRASLSLPRHERPRFGKFTTTLPNPVVLQICRASRREALKLYTRAFDTLKQVVMQRWHCSAASNWHPTSIGLSEASETDTAERSDEPLNRYSWVNFKVDTVRLTHNAFWRMPERDRALTRRLVLEIEEPLEDFIQYKYMFASMRELVSLDIITPNLRDWDRLLDVLWGYFQDLFGELEGWTHPDVRIVQESTGEVMHYLNEERWLDRFAAERCVVLMKKRKIDAGVVGDCLGVSDRGEASSSDIPRKRSQRWLTRASRRRPRDPREEVVEVDDEE